MQCRSAFADTHTELWIVLVAIDASPIKNKRPPFGLLLSGTEVLLPYQLL